MAVADLLIGLLKSIVPKFILPLAVLLIGNILRKEQEVKKTGWVVFLIGLISLVWTIYDQTMALLP